MWKRRRRSQPEPAVEMQAAVYAAVANRRTAFDQMLWQVPIISFTAQAFLFTIALSGSSTQLARTIASALALLISGLSIYLMARHRQAELTDAEELARLEALAELVRVQHGIEWSRRRDATQLRGPIDVRPPGRAYDVWVAGLLLFGAAAAFIIVLTWAAPGSLSVPPVS